MTQTEAEATIVRLQQAERDGRPVMIPGARETRPSHPLAPPAAVVPHAPAPHTPGIDTDRAKLEREREGGGAPSERGNGHPRTRLARFWRRVFRPADGGPVL